MLAIVRLRWTFGHNGHYNPAASKTLFVPASTQQVMRACLRSPNAPLRTATRTHSLPEINGRPCGSGFFGKTVKTGR